MREMERMEIGVIADKFACILTEGKMRMKKLKISDQRFNIDRSEQFQRLIGQNWLMPRIPASLILHSKISF